MRRKPLSFDLMALLATSALATGCLGEGRPLDEYQRDQERFEQLADGGPVQVADAGADDGPEPTHPGCSPYSSQPTYLHLINAYTRAEVAASWVDVHCHEVPYVRLQPGEELFVPTYVGHVWRMREGGSGALLREYQVGASNTSPTMRVP